MNKTEKQEVITKALTDSLNKIAESVIKNLDQPANNDSNSKPTEQPSVESNNEPTENGTVEKNQNSELTDLIKNLQSKIDSLEKKFDSGVKTTEEVAEENITKKKSEIQAGMVELVKSMGLDPENLDVNFVIKEKKKSEVENDGSEDSEKFSKEKSEATGDLEKQLENLSDEEKSEALNVYFKNFIKK